MLNDTDLLEDLLMDQIRPNNATLTNWKEKVDLDLHYHLAVQNLQYGDYGYSQNRWRSQVEAKWMHYKLIAQLTISDPEEIDKQLATDTTCWMMKHCQLCNATFSPSFYKCHINDEDHCRRESRDQSNVKGGCAIRHQPDMYGPYPKSFYMDTTN